MAAAVVSETTTEKMPTATLLAVLAARLAGVLGGAGPIS